MADRVDHAFLLCLRSPTRFAATKPTSNRHDKVHVQNIHDITQPDHHHADETARWPEDQTADDVKDGQDWRLDTVTQNSLEVPLLCAAASRYQSS
eukprot:CAMPEP_0181407674 /NCGR_PEP_ID=MMETSP1110-20121109/5900_1 /TAXON_ID=174948 /ORGANISM="Symbiodinium sp., Strain CCMP421" /LENGTH=94 /DNA_ID=CAMNT_0023530107 /DNA_START=192 /DNA_END=476 /DNA_ORIENTATION=-